MLMILDLNEPYLHHTMQSISLKVLLTLSNEQSTFEEPWPG